MGLEEMSNIFKRLWAWLRPCDHNVVEFASEDSLPYYLCCFCDHRMIFPHNPNTIIINSEGEEEWMTSLKP